MVVRVGIIGTGWGVKVQIPAFRHAGMEIVALWARSQDKANQLGQELKIPFVSTDFNAIITHPDVDLISVVTPPNTHCDLAIAALEAGKHVICDKPTALNVEEAQKMLECAKKHPSQLAIIDHELRFVGMFQKLRELVQQGFCGELYHAEVLLGRDSSIHRPWNWWSERSKGGGLLGAVGSHYVDMLSWACGSRITQVNAMLRTFVKQRKDSDSNTMRDVDSDDFFVANLRFDNNMTGLLHMSLVTKGPPFTKIQVTGSKGTVQVFADGPNELRAFDERDNQVLRLVEDMSDIAGLNESISRRVDYHVWAKGTYLLAKSIVAYLEGRSNSNSNSNSNNISNNNNNNDLKTIGATFEDGAYVQAVLDAATKSSDNGGTWVSL